MNVHRHHPSARLAPYVREFLIIESDGTMDSKILPDTSLVMSLRYKGATRRVEMAEESPFSPSVLTGLRRSHRVMRYSPDTGNILVLFNEGGLVAFSRVPANELFDMTIPAENFFAKADMRDVLEALADATDNETRIRTIEAFLTQQLRDNKPDPLVGETVRLIKDSKGLIKIKDLAGTLHISQDPLEKRFRTQVGTTPKQYASIIRLRNIIDTWSSYPSLTNASYEAGYFDQSHFIKDFRAFTGESPKDFFRSARFW